MRSVITKVLLVTVTALALAAFGLWLFFASDRLLVSIPIPEQLIDLMKREAISKETFGLIVTVFHHVFLIAVFSFFSIVVCLVLRPAYLSAALLPVILPLLFFAYAHRPSEWVEFAEGGGERIYESIDYANFVVQLGTYVVTPLVVAISTYLWIRRTRETRNYA